MTLKVARWEGSYLGAHAELTALWMTDESSKAAGGIQIVTLP
jgi:hypothetical protein